MADAGELLPINAHRDFIASHPGQRNSANGISGLFVENKATKEAEPLGRLLDVEEIRQQLMVIDKLIKSYEKFVVDYDSGYGARIMEIFFTPSPGLFSMRSNRKLEKRRFNWTCPFFSF